jgi:hypothetical protein
MTLWSYTKTLNLRASLLFIVLQTCWYSFRYGDVSPIDSLLPSNAQP